MFILELKGANLDKRGPKWARLDFPTTVNLNFFKKRTKDKFIHQKPTKVNEPFERYKLKYSI